MLVTLSGILMQVRVSHPENALSPMLVTLFGMLYVLSFALYAIIIVLSALNKIWFSKAVFVYHFISINYVLNGRKVKT